MCWNQSNVNLYKLMYTFFIKVGKLIIKSIKATGNLNAKWNIFMKCFHGFDDFNIF